MALIFAHSCFAYALSKQVNIMMCACRFLAGLKDICLALRHDGHSIMQCSSCFVSDEIVHPL